MPKVVSRSSPSVWTDRRKTMGNLLPFLAWVPFAVAGLTVMAVTAEILGFGLVLLVVATFAGWLALNYFGLFENEKMKVELAATLQKRGESDFSDCPFVGFCSPRYHGVLDAHEDIGFLKFLPDRIEFISESRIVEFEREAIDRVILRPNVHSIVGLGRWVCVEGKLYGKPLRMLLESRQNPTMLANRKASAVLRKRIILWAASPPLD